MKKEKRTEKEEENVEYIGNIWGWKFSFISLGIILFFVILMAILHLTMEPQDPEKGKTAWPNDSLQNLIEVEN